MKGRMKLAVTALGLATVLAVPAMAQDRDHDGDRWGRNGQSVWQNNRDRDHDRDHARNGNKPYDRGYREGQRDRQHNRRYSPNGGGSIWTRGDYERGYRDGYGYRQNGRDADDRGGYYGGWVNGNGNYGRGGSSAEQIGYQEGLRYGRFDRNAGKPFRPTDSQVYNDGDRGYNSRYGDRGAYRRDFRAGYRAGYQQGYGAGQYGYGR